MMIGAFLFFNHQHWQLFDSYDLRTTTKTNKQTQNINNNNKKRKKEKENNNNNKKTDKSYSAL